MIPIEKIHVINSKNLVFGLSREQLFSVIIFLSLFAFLCGYYVNSGGVIQAGFMAILYLMVLFGYTYTTSIRTKQIEIITTSGETISFVTREEWEQIDEVVNKIL